jgi:hypothetical protein
MMLGSILSCVLVILFHILLMYRSIYSLHMFTKQLILPYRVLQPQPNNMHNLSFKEVYDHDMFSADDIMGEAEIDLQPMITAAMAFGDPSRLGDMQIGRWFMTKDNALLKDSTVNAVSGKIKQEVHLKLQNVESGEIELELEWVSL